jgi:HTH-type transcriptional regulator, sugar sensing transcriptional regulator
MREEELVAELGSLGLNTYEAKAYTALLGKPSWSAPQVADQSGVPRQRIYDILASLSERGLVVTRPSRRGTKYAGVAPDVALPSLLAKEQQRLAVLQATTTALVEALRSRYVAGQEETSPLEYIEVLRGEVAISQRFNEIQAHCRREILVFTKPPYAKPPEENVEGLASLKRHIRACSVYEYEVLRDPSQRAAIADFLRQGEEARFVDHLPMKLVIVDEAIVMFAMEDPVAGRPDLTIMVIENPQLAFALKLAFNTIWAQGVPFDVACARLNGRPAGTEVAQSAC